MCQLFFSIVDALILLNLHIFQKNKLLAADFLEEIDDVLEEKNNINNLTKKASKKSRAKQDDSLQFP